MRTIAMVLPLLLALHARAEESAEPPAPLIEITGESSVVSKYVWRGYVINDSPSLQPGVTVAVRGGLSFSAWSNFSRTVPHNQKWTETDLSVEYTRGVGRLSLSVGLLEYTYPDLTTEEDNRTTEISAGVSWDSVLSPSYKLYRDIEGGHGNYHYASVSHSFLLRKQGSLDVSAGVGVNQHLYQRQTTISDAGTTLTWNLPPRRHLRLSPFVNISAGHRTLFGSHWVFGLKTSWAR